MSKFKRLYCFTSTLLPFFPHFCPRFFWACLCVRVRVHTNALVAVAHNKLANDPKLPLPEPETNCRGAFPCHQPPCFFSPTQREPMQRANARQILLSHFHYLFFTTTILFFPISLSFSLSLSSQFPTLAVVGVVVVLVGYLIQIFAACRFIHQLILLTAILSTVPK